MPSVHEWSCDVPLQARSTDGDQRRQLGISRYGRYHALVPGGKKKKYVFLKKLIHVWQAVVVVK